MLKKALEFLKYGLMEDRAEISALPENEASRRTILANGGVYRDSIFVERENATLDRFLIDLTNSKGGRLE